MGSLLEPIRLHSDPRIASGQLAGLYKSIPTARGEAFLDFCAEALGTGRCDATAGARLWMTWEMAARLLDTGMVIGGHTVTHPVLARADPAVQRTEIEGCARRLLEQLGVRMHFFAYPVGLPTAFDDGVQRILKRAGVTLAFSLYGGYLCPGRFDPYDVPRASVGSETQLPAFRAMLSAPRLFARW